MPKTKIPKKNENVESEIKKKIKKINEEKIDLLTEKLVTENTTEKLRALYEETTGVAPSRNAQKDHFARKIATIQVMGRDSSETMKSDDGSSPVVEPAPDESSALKILEKVKNGFDDIEQLTEEKRVKSAELRQQVMKSREAIQAVVIDENMDAGKRIALIEGHWRMLTRTEEKRTAINAEFNEQIKAAKVQVRNVLSNIRQISLPLDDIEEDH